MAPKIAPRSSKKYASVEAAALAGFKKVMTSYPDYTKEEHGFLVVSEVVTVDGGVMYYRYTEPVSAGEREEINVEIPPLYAPIVRAFCHTHPTGSTYSTQDFESFKKLEALTKDNKLKHEIVFYLLRGDGQVQRSADEKNFFK